MANTYKFPSGGLRNLAEAWQIAFTVDSEFDAAIVTSCMVSNTTASISGENVAVNVGLYNNSNSFERYWANNLTVPWGSSVNVIDGYQNLPSGWSVRAQGAVSGALDISVSAIGVTYA